MYRDRSVEFYDMKILSAKSAFGDDGLVLRRHGVLGQECMNADTSIAKVCVPMRIVNLREDSLNAHKRILFWLNICHRECV